MTIVCYDGEYLAADRKSTRRDLNGDRETRSLTRNKIKVGLKSKIMGQQIVAVGHAGKVGMTKLLLKFLKAGTGLDRKDLYHGAKTVEAVIQETYTLADKPIPTASLLIVTSTNVFVVRVEREGTLHFKQYLRSEQVAIGTHTETALFLMRHLNLDARYVVQSMELATESVGGGVTYTSRILSAQEQPIIEVEQLGKEDLLFELNNHTNRMTEEYVDAHADTRSLH